MFTVRVITRDRILSNASGSMGSKTPSWADQWGNNNVFDEEEHDDKAMTKKGSNGTGKKMQDVKAAVSLKFGKAKEAASVGVQKVGLDKAKGAATVGAHKVKSGTSLGIKWVKNQYQKYSSK